jgi:hypothetical protein
MRAAADKAERVFNRIGLLYANAEHQLRFFTNEITLFKRAKKDTTELETHRAAAAAAVKTTHADWVAALEKHEELWGAYIAASKAEEAAEAAHWAEHEKGPCSFCGQPRRECGEDHGDEMREICREKERRGRF